MESQAVCYTMSTRATYGEVTSLASPASISDREPWCRQVDSALPVNQIRTDRLDIPAWWNAP